MKVLVLGAGGREHALVWRLVRDPDVSRVICAPGNPGIAALAPCFSLDPNRPADVLALAGREAVDLTVVGPEAPLERGIADLFRQHGRAIVGPGAHPAALECSKSFAKGFMARHEIPTARFQVCDAADRALAAVADFGFPVVIKADGLAAGKGVIIAADRDEAQRAVRSLMVERAFGEAGSTIVIEECLTGPEVSFFVLCDGVRAIVLGTAQDHKRIWDDDRGPNTGGMGAFAPSPLISDALVTDVMARIVSPVMRGMEKEHGGYRGFLYVSLMLTADGPKVIEFNVRLGDPETQVLMPLIEGRFASALLASANGSLGLAAIARSERKCVGVVLASRGYPGAVESGYVISGLERAEAMSDVIVFHAGTAAAPEGVVTSGGRVLTVVGSGDTFEDAMSTAYRAVDAIHFDGMQYRRDIGRKAIAAGSAMR